MPGSSAKDMKRPGVQEALRVLEAGEATALVVAKLDRLSRSMIDFTALMGTAQKQQLGARRARLRGGHLDADGRGDGEHARDVRAVRAAADLAADEGGARGEARERGSARAASHASAECRPPDSAAARAWGLAAQDRR